MGKRVEAGKRGREKGNELCFILQPSVEGWAWYQVPVLAPTRTQPLTESWEV